MKKIFTVLVLLVIGFFAQAQSLSIELTEKNRPSSVPLFSLNTPFGYNTVKLFSNGIYLGTNSVGSIKKMGAQVLRFPGGMVGNYYHPNGNGLGYKSNEIPFNSFYTGDLDWSNKVANKNLIYYFIDYAKQLGVTEVIYVANVWTGTVDEMKQVIDTFLSNGLSVKRVELGNEMMFNPFISKIKNGAGYVNMIKPFAQELRRAYPNIKIGVVGWHNVGQLGANPGFPKTKEWNTSLQQFGLFDAFIFHEYRNIKSCDSKADLQSTFVCVNGLTHFQKNKYLENITKYFKSFDANKEVWMTEFNVDDPYTRIGNTFLHASQIFEIALLTVDEILAGRLNVVVHHNLGANTVSGMAALYGWANQPLNHSTSALALEYFREAQNLVTDSYAQVSTLATAVDKDTEVITRVFKSGQKTIIFYTNKSSKNVNFSVKKTDGSKLTKITSSKTLQGSQLWSTHLDPAYKVGGGKNWMISPLNINAQITSWVIPSYSLGYLVLE